MAEARSTFGLGPINTPNIHAQGNSAAADVFRPLLGEQPGNLVEGAPVV
jgi:hypothetical protein